MLDTRVTIDQAPVMPNPPTFSWTHTRSTVNLRGSPDEAEFRDGVRRALKLELPVQPNTTASDRNRRLVWAGPDDWFYLAHEETSETTEQMLREQLAGQHCAITDVSSGYVVLGVRGPGAASLLSHGCPLDLHERSFKAGTCAGSHFFKAGIWLWPSDDGPGFDLIVRRSFQPYVDGLLLRHGAMRSSEAE